MRERNIPVQVMLNEEEFKKLDSLSHKSGLSFSVVLRRLITGTDIRERWSPDYRSLLRAIEQYGNNLNQIAHMANTTRAVSDDALDEAVAIVKQMRREFVSWKDRWQ